MLQLLIARHGNTFDKGDTILRVGCGTDLPLSQSGQLQAKKLGQYLQQHHPDITAVYTSHLKRTIETADIALEQMNIAVETQQQDFLNEVDYGPDEGKPETDVIERLGKEALELWESDNLVPNGWNIDPLAITQRWLDFVEQRQQDSRDKIILVVTSNGIARFAPGHTIKLKTGAVSLITINNNVWHAEYTNHRPM